MISRHALACAVPGSSAFRRGSGDASEIFLTFDDGPHPEVTPRLLELLDEYGAKASFFVVGQALEANTDVAREAHRRGHSLGNHSWRHRGFSSMPVAAQLEEIAETDAGLEAIDGRRRHAFRPPQGRLTPALLATLSWRRHPVALWSADSRDYEGDAALVERRLETLEPRAGEMVLFHDDADTCFGPLRRFIERSLEAGYRFPALSAA